MPVIIIAQEDRQRPIARCSECGDEEAIQLPLAIDAVVAWIRYIEVKHQYCKKSEEP